MPLSLVDGYKKCKAGNLSCYICSIQEIDGRWRAVGGAFSSRGGCRDKNVTVSYTKL